MPVAVVLTQCPDLGPACADRLAADGWRVVLVPVGADLDLDLDPGPGIAVAEPVDPRHPEAGLAALVATIDEDADPRVDAVVTIPGPWTTLSVLRGRGDAFTDHLATTAGWPFAAIGRLGPRLVRSPAGRVVIVTSVVALRGGAWEAPHGAATAALIGLSRSLARELGPAGVTVNAVAVGAVRTRRLESVAATRAGRRHVAEVEERSALGRLGDPADVAHAVAWLASPGAAYVTGTLLGVDGGLAMGFG